MRLVIADTSPINYLLLIGHIDTFPARFDVVLGPPDQIGPARELVKCFV